MENWCTKAWLSCGSSFCGGEANLSCVFMGTKDAGDPQGCPTCLHIHHFIHLISLTLSNYYRSITVDEKVLDSCVSCQPVTEIQDAVSVDDTRVVDGRKNEV